MVVHRGGQRRFTSRSFRYQDLKEIGVGAFGKVFRGVLNGRAYALKRYTYSKAPVHTTTVREIKTLRGLQHPNIIELVEVVVAKNQIWTVFPHCETDLSRLILSQELTTEDCKHILRGILRGVQHMHSRGIVHRDLKASNILIDTGSSAQLHGQRMAAESKTDEAGSVESELNSDALVSKHRKIAPGIKIIGSEMVKICDMGMAKPVSRDMSPGTVTLWYRAPEILLGCTHYNHTVDIWSIGCILYEMASKGEPLFKGTTELEQLKLISKICGPITLETMPDAATYPGFSALNLASGKRTLHLDYQTVPPDMLDLIDSMLSLNPDTRLPIEDCLKHPFLA